MRFRSIVLASPLVTILAAQVRAQCAVGFINFDIPIPETGATAINLSCAGSLGTVQTVRLSLRIEHGRQGDLAIRLRHNASGTVATVLNRPGTEDGQSTVGYTAANFGNLAGQFVRFSDLGAGPYAVPPVGAYPRPGIEDLVGDFKPTFDPMSIFAGLPIDSNWTLEVSDANPGVTGVVDSAGLEVSRTEPATCYANCDSSFIQPFLNVMDYTCFLNRFGAGHSYANCDASTIAPVLNINDFMCFHNLFVAGCALP